jgi:O-antigen ligase
LPDDAGLQPFTWRPLDNNSSAWDASAPSQPMMTDALRRTLNRQAGRNGMFRKAAFFLVWMLVFVIPWENGVIIHGFGTISKVVGICAFGMAMLAILESGTLRSLAAQHILILLFFFWAGLTYFWSFDPSATAVSIYTFVQIFLMVWLVWEFAQTRQELLLLLRAYTAGALVSSVAALVGYFRNTGLQNGRYTGMGFNPGDLAFILALAIPISLYLAVQERRKIMVWLAGMATVFSFCTIVLTASRGSLVACVPSIVILPLLFPNVRWGRSLVMLVFFAAAGIGAWLFMPDTSWSRLSTIKSEITSGTLNERKMIWQTGWQIFGQAPFQGVGSEAFAGTAEHTLGLASDSRTDVGTSASRLAAHNTFFSILLEEGAIGFTLFLALLIALILSTWRLPFVDRTFWLCILATWAVGALDLTWEDRKPTWLMFAMLIAAVCAKTAPQKHLWRKRTLSETQYPATSPLSAEISPFQLP